MSNPLINRWGFNLFWYNFWYNDKNSSFQNSIDTLITKLLFTYINYGLLFQKNIFFTKYWYKDNNESEEITTNLFKKYDLKYFRIMEHKNKITGELTQFYTRLVKKDIYFSKIWILRYHGWIIINIMSFQPLKKKKIHKKNKRYAAAVINPFTNQTDNDFLLIFRLKIYLHFLINKFLIKKNLYYFF